MLKLLASPVLGWTLLMVGGGGGGMVPIDALMDKRTTWLDPDNYDEKTMGKTAVFLMFTSPDCPHCTLAKSEWEQLVTDYQESPTFLVASVDCSQHPAFCIETFGVDGVPDFRYGNPAENGQLLEVYDDVDYDYETFQEFAFSMFMGPQCNEQTLEHCSDAQKETIENFRFMDTPDYVAPTGDSAHAPKRGRRVSRLEQRTVYHRENEPKILYSAQSRGGGGGRRTIDRRVTNHHHHHRATVGNDEL